MKKIVLLIWLIIISVSPFLNDEADFAIFSQLEICIVIWMLWYFNAILNSKQFNNILLTLGVFYSWIYLTDGLFADVPLVLLLFENLFAFCLMLINTEDN